MARRPAIQVTGIKELRKALRDFEPEALPELRRNLKAAADVVVSDIKSHTPVGQPEHTVTIKGRTFTAKYDRHLGRAKDAVRVTAGGNVVNLVGGKSTSPYFGWLEFGGTIRKTGKRKNASGRPFVKKGRSFFPAIERNADALQQAAEKALDEARRATGLGD